MEFTNNKGKTIIAKIDSDDLQKVLDKGHWFAEWNKDFNNYVIQRYIDINKNSLKQSLNSFIIDADPKAPIRHINGDTLDNRKCNLEIYDINTPNDYETLDEATSAIILRDKYGMIKEKALIDKEDLDKVINYEYAWTYYKSRGKSYAVANTPDGRIFLDRFLMDTPEEHYVHHINLNTLDNRKANMENVKIEEEIENESEEV